MRSLRVIGIDMALANMGLVKASLDLDSMVITPIELKLITTQSNKDKQVRKSSSELARARVLGEAMHQFCAGASFAFAEVPSGSQSAQAARALGIAVGVLSRCPIPLVEVSPMEVKHLFATKRSVPKAEIINWAVNNWPHQDWLRYKRKGKMQLTQDNEHLADALATIVAGVKTQQFQLLKAMHHATPMPDLDRPSPGRRRQRILSLGSLSVSGGEGFCQ